MKRYLLFGGHVYYPRGGWRDFIGSFDTVEEAEKFHYDGLESWEKEELGRYNWHDIVDRDNWAILGA